jgi:hypothetical protein
MVMGPSLSLHDRLIALVRRSLRRRSLDAFH